MRSASVAGVAQKHTNLAVLDAACRAAVLALHTGGILALLEEACLIHDQHGVTFAELFNDVVAKDVASRVRIPLRPFEKVLHAIGCGLADPFCELQPFLRSTVPSRPLR